MSLTDLNLRPVYNHGNCPDLLAGLYEPLAGTGRPPLRRNLWQSLSARTVPAAGAQGALL